MKTESVPSDMEILLTRADLKNTRLQDRAEIIILNDFKVTAEFDKAASIIFKDDDGSRFILKDRHNKYQRYAPNPSSTTYRHTREEAITKAQEFMLREYGLPIEMKDPEQRERYHTRLGLLVHFIGELFPQ